MAGEKTGSELHDLQTAAMNLLNQELFDFDPVAIRQLGEPELYLMLHDTLYDAGEDPDELLEVYGLFS